jgi:hypothetical protein
LFAGGLVAPGYAAAQPPVPATGATLYETTENLSMKALASGRRKATSELLGFAVRGTPLCPEELLQAIQSTATYCTLNATGSDNISLKTGKGDFNGTVTVVVQEVNPVTGVATPDSPEVVIARGRFTGKMDFSPAVLEQIPLGSVRGHLTLNGLTRRLPFTGIFRLPFVLAVPASAEVKAVAQDTAWYLLGTPDSLLLSTAELLIVPVAPNEMAIGYPAVRFEISF